ncbi:MAG TPA: glycosyltransferase family 2 protein [Gemmatimonadaceae bacterium]
MATDSLSPARPALVSVVTACFNEEGNVREMYEAIKAIFAELPQYRYEHIFIDNASKDGTARILRALAAEDPRVKVILNARNFGHVRSPVYAITQATGDAVAVLACDFQEPPALIPTFLEHWEAGAKIVVGVKTRSDEPGLFYFVRDRYYKFLAQIADVGIVNQTTGFGVYDKAVIEGIRRIDDPYPFFRGLLAEIGFEPVQVPYTQARRLRGITSQNFYSLYDIAFLGIVNHSKVPLRLAAMLGFLMSCLSFLLTIGYLAAKLLFWDRFQFGLAPILIGFFFISSLQLFFVGILGEYIGSIYTQVRHHPLVFEKERINF